MCDTDKQVYLNANNILFVRTETVTHVRMIDASQSSALNDV